LLQKVSYPNKIFKFPEKLQKSGQGWQSYKPNFIERLFSRGSVPLTSDPDPDPALFASNLQDANQKLLFFFAYFLMKVHLHYSSQIISHKEVTKQ
jgi:hypothetical protein